MQGGRTKLYTPLSGLLDLSSHPSYHSHRTPSEGIPHRLPRLRKSPPYPQSLRCRLGPLTRPESLLPPLRSPGRRGIHLAGSHSTQLPTITTQTTLLPGETHGLEVLPSSVSRTSASFGGRAAPKPRYPSLPRVLARTLPHHPPSLVIHHNLNTHPFLLRELHLVLSPFWNISDSTRIQNIPFTLIKAL